MDISKGRIKNSRKFYKKTTKFLNCVQKHTIRNNHHSGTEKLVHQTIQIANLQTEKYPANHESCKYYILKRRFTVKQRKLGKNGEYISNSQDQSRRCKQTHFNRFFISPSSYTLGMDELNKILKKKCPSEKIKKCYDPYSNSAPIVNNKLFGTKSFESEMSSKQITENVCIVNNELNCGNALLFQCSAASLQLEKSKILETKKRNLNDLKQNIVNMKKSENYNNINDILPKLMQQVTVYRILENLKRENYSEDNVYSSMSTCSSTSSTREYYLPAISSSTDTIHVANVLTNRRLAELPNPQEKIISKQQNTDQGIYKNSSNLPPTSQQAPLENEILPFNSIGTKRAGLDEHKKSNHQIMKDNNNDLLDFFPFSRFNSLAIKNKSRVIKNYEQSSVGVQTQDNNIYENDEDDSVVFKTIKNKRIKLSKENFIVNKNATNNESVGKTIEKNKKKDLNLSPLAAYQNYELMDNFNKANNEVTKILSEHLHGSHSYGKEKISYSSSNISDISILRPKNKSISEDVLITVNEKRNKAHKIKTVIQKPKSSLCISNVKSESSKSPLYFKSHPNASDDSLNASKPHFVKLNPFFDAGFKDPKISRLILSSRTLAGESDSAIPKVKIHPDVPDSNAETFTANLSNRKYIKPAAIVETETRSSINEENKLKLVHGYTSNRSIFSADSIVYGSNAFQKIREKFNLLKNKIKIDKENEKFQEQESLNKRGVSTPEVLLEKNVESINNFKDISQDNNNNRNITTLSNSVLMNENQKKDSLDSFENEGFVDKMKYLLLFPKKLEISNQQSELFLNEFSHIDEKEKTIDLSDSHGKFVDISIMDDEHELININLTSNSSKHLKPSSSKHEIKKSEKETIDTKHLSEKQTQVNMYIVETPEKTSGDPISNKIPIKENHEISVEVSNKVVQTVMEDDNSPTEAIMLPRSNNNTQTEATMLNNNIQTEVTLSNNNVEAKARITNNTVEDKTMSNNGQAEGTMLNNYGQPVILFNSSGYPITDLNGRVLKNNLGAYLLNSDKYEDVIAKQLPVFDCDLMSVSSICFNPTKVPFVKMQLKITDKCGNPVSLFNNLGWPLTNKDGFFLHDNLGKLLVEMDSFNFPFCCSNGSPIYLQNGAMLLSQKFRFIVTKPDAESNSTVRSLKLGRRYENEVVNSYNRKDNKISNVKIIESKTIQPLNESNSKDFEITNLKKTKKRKPNFKHSLFLPTEVPELMHEFFDNKAKPRFSNNRSQGNIPQSPIPIFDRAGNRLTDENGFPLRNKYGEYMLLLDKNGIALSDSCGGPIFDSYGKQLLLKDLYHMKKFPSTYHLYDRYMPPEHPYIDNSMTSIDQTTPDSSDDLIPLLDLNFEHDQCSEPIMNYIKENNVNTCDSNGKQVYYIQNLQTHRKPIRTNFFKHFSVPTNEEHYGQPPMAGIKENLLFYKNSSYQEEGEYGNLYKSLSQQIDEGNVPYNYDQSIYEGSIFSQEHPQVNNLEEYDNYYYHDQTFPEISEVQNDAEIQYYVDDNNYVMYY